MAKVIKPPTPLRWSASVPSVFLAGSIEMGQAEDWQTTVTNELAKRDIVILNPRRDDWDATWEQTISNKMFRRQVEWELSAQEKATFILMYFAPATKAPITLLELGLAAQSEKLVVCCPDGFWRKGNVDIVCKRYRVPMVSSLQNMVKWIRRKLDTSS